jgi:hypothetical protein
MPVTTDHEFEDQGKAIERTLIISMYFIKILKTTQTIRIQRRNWHNFLEGMQIFMYYGAVLI